MIISLDQLSRLFPHTSRAQLSKYVDPLNKLLPRYHIDQPLRIRAFLAQIGHETMEFSRFEENLNYSANGLRSVFRSHFTPAEAQQYARKPEAIANRVYANRLGNGNERSGDGWKYRGRGGIQITGKYNYERFAHFVGMSLDDTMKYLETPEGQIMSACWYWDACGLNRWADGQDLRTITRKINGGLNGFDDRMRLWNNSRSIITGVVEDAPQSKLPTKTVNTPVLNVRKGPSIDAERVSTLEQGMKVQIIAEYGDWSQIQLQGQFIGYVASKFLS